MLKSALPLVLCSLARPMHRARQSPPSKNSNSPTSSKPTNPSTPIPSSPTTKQNTSALVATELRKAGYTVTDHIGIYPDGSKAYGVVGILKNGPGPMLLVRGDMDALPIIEETGVPYASHVLTKNKSGQEVGVMHACGHDVHTTVLIGTARTLAQAKSQWHGTLMILAQPSEETIDGAKAMLADHLYDRFGKPDMIIGLHDTNEHAAGTVGISPGPAMASATSVNVTIRGIGGHGAQAFNGRDPIVLAAMYILQIQTIVSRELDPRDPGIITVGDIHGGTKGNIIPDEVKLELSTRAFSDKGPPGHPRRPPPDGHRHRHLRRPSARQDAHRHGTRGRVHSRSLQRSRALSPRKDHARQNARRSQRIRRPAPHRQRRRRHLRP